MTIVSWYDHDCEWVSKYCDEHHRRSAVVEEVHKCSLKWFTPEEGIMYTFKMDCGSECNDD